MAKKKSKRAFKGDIKARRKSRGERLNVPIVKARGGRPVKRSRPKAKLQRGPVPNDGDAKTQFFASEVFSPSEGEDLQCKVVDKDGVAIPMSGRWELLILGPM